MGDANVGKKSRLSKISGYVVDGALAAKMNIFVIVLGCVCVTVITKGEKHHYNLPRNDMQV